MGKERSSCELGSMLGEEDSVIKSIKALGAVSALAAIAAVGGVQTASAHNGMLPHCTGVIKCGMGGAGVALATDATNAAVNPALMGEVGNELHASVGWFHTERWKDQSRRVNAASSTAPKEYSQLEDYPDGALGVNYKIDSNWSVGVAAYSTGGGETKYSTNRVSNALLFDTNVRIRMFQVAPTIAYTTPSGKASYGLSLIYGYQDFKTNFMTSLNAQTTGNDKKDTANGYGFRVGGLWKFDKGVNLGASYTSKVQYQRLTKYRDVFIGAIDAPPIMQAGMALTDLLPSTEVALDWKNIGWSKVFAINTTPQNGGFGWEDQNVFMIGVQHHLTDAFTLRAGYSYADAPFDNDKVFANLMFPAINQHHITVGAGFQITDAIALNGSAYYSPEETMTDPGSGDIYSVRGNQTEIGHMQYGAMAGLSWKF